MEKINPYEYLLYIDQCQKYWYMNELSVGNITSGLKNNMKQSSLIPSFYFLLWFSIVRDFFFPFLQRLFVILSGMSLLKSCFLWGIHPWIYCSLSANKAFKSCFNDSKKMIWTMIINFFLSLFWYSQLHLHQISLLNTQNTKNVPKHCLICMSGTHKYQAFRYWMFVLSAQIYMYIIKKWMFLDWVFFWSHVVHKNIWLIF